LITFPTFGFETLCLVEEGSGLEAVLNTTVSLLVGFVACAGGWVLAAGLA
jgi:fluoride exporter